MYVGAERRVVTECGAGNGVLRTDVEETLHPLRFRFISEVRAGRFYGQSLETQEA